MAAYEQFTEYDVELEVPEKAVQELDENVRKCTSESYGLTRSRRDYIEAQDSKAFSNP